MFYRMCEGRFSRNPNPDPYPYSQEQPKHLFNILIYYCMRKRLPLEILSLCTRLLLFPLFLLLALFAQAATITSISAGGSWDNPATWGGVVPGINDDVVIAGPVNVPTNYTPKCRTLTINDGKTLTLGNRDLDVTVSLTIIGSGAIAANGKSISYSNGAVLIYSGNTPKTVGVEWPSKAPLGSVSILNTGGVTLDNSKTLTATNPTPANTALIIGDGTIPALFNDGGFQITSTGTLQLLSGTFRLGSAATATTFPAFGTRTINAGTTIEYAAGAAQTVSTLPAYANLRISGNSTKTLAGNLTVTGDLVVSSGVLDLLTYTANRTAMGGTLTVADNASLLVGGAANFPANYSTYALGSYSLVNYNGTNQAIANAPYGNLLLSGSGTKTLPATPTAIAGNFSTSGNATAVAQASLVIGRNVGITTGSVFNAGAFTHTVGGEWLILGSFIKGSSTIDFTGGGAVQIGAGSFHNVVFSGAGTKTATGALAISGNVTINNNFYAGGYTHTIGGNWTNNGIFDGTGSTVVFNGSAVQTISGSIASTFNHVAVQNAGGVVLAQNSTVGGTLTLATGGLTVASGFTATVQHLEAGTYQVAGDGNYVLPAGGSITTANANGVDNGSSGTIAVAGTRDYAATGASFTFKAPTTTPLPVPVSGVQNLSIEADVTLNKDISVAGTVTLASGRLTIPTGKTLRLAAPNAIAGSGFDASKHIVTEVNTTDGSKGFVQVDGITTSYTFPVGNGTYYLPVTLNPNGIANNFAVCVFPGVTTNGEPNGTPFTAAQKDATVDAVWMVNRLSGSGGVDMTISWPQALEGTYFQTLSDDKLGIAHYGSAWEKAYGSGSNTANTATRTGITSFSPFGAGQVFVTLPVKFSTFQALRRNEAVDLEWETVMEENNLGFTVQRKTNGAWQNIAVVPSKAPGGNSTSPLAYAFKDLNAYTGVSQYRILQTDIDGKFTFSDVRSVKGATQLANLVAYPNPSANGTVNLVLGDVTGSDVRVLDAMGRLVKAYRTTGSNSQVISGLRSGLYTVQVVDSNGGLVGSLPVLVQ